MPTVTFVPCDRCHAEISTDREKCPLCGAPVPVASSSAGLQAENARLKQLLKEQDERLALENKNLSAKLSGPSSSKVPEGWPKEREYRDGGGHSWKWNQSATAWQ